MCRSITFNILEPGKMTVIFRRHFEMRLTEKMFCILFLPFHRCPFPMGHLKINRCFCSYWPFTNMEYLESQNGWIIMYIIKCSMKLLIYSQTSAAAVEFWEWMSDSIMMLVKFSDLSQSDRSNWVMWQVKDPCPRPGWDGCLTREKMAFIKSIKTWIILLYIWLHLKNQSEKINK